MTVQISEAFVALVPRSVAIPGISSTCNGLLHVKFSHRYEFSRVLYRGLISFLSFFSQFLPLFLFTSSFSSYRLYCSHEMWCYWCWNKEIIFLSCVKDRYRSFGKRILYVPFSPFLFVSFIMSLCYLSFFNRYRSQYYGTTKRTDLSRSSWTRPQALREGCWVSWLTAVTERTSVCCLLLTEYRFVLSFIRVAVRSTAWVFGRSFAGIAGSKSAEGIDVSLLWVLCVVR